MDFRSRSLIIAVGVGFACRVLNPGAPEWDRLRGVVRRLASMTTRSLQVRARRTAGLRIALFFLAVAAFAAANAASPVDTFPDLWRAILACWNPPAGSEGSEITLRFGLTGRGELRGPPMVTYSRLIGPSPLQKAFALSALRAVAQCTPVSLTEGLGRIVAQRVLTLRFTQRPMGRPPI